jgi:hypothetical protein
MGNMGIVAFDAAPRASFVFNVGYRKWARWARCFELVAREEEDLPFPYIGAPPTPPELPTVNAVFS